MIIRTFDSRALNLPFPGCVRILNPCSYTAPLSSDEALDIANSNLEYRVESKDGRQFNLLFLAIAHNRFRTH